MAKKKGKFAKMVKKMNGTSKLEDSFAELLEQENINFERHFVFKKREFDFLLVDYNVLIETHGCFYHCCKKHSPEAKYAFQRANLRNDQYKVKLVKFDRTYNLLVIWEHEMDKTNLVVERVNKFIEKYGIIKG
jgi:G:T-mismatch repair DNA endonuclease (very short patch repair protein)